MDPIAAFNQSADLAGGIVRGVKADQFGGPTPCSDFDVKALLNHMTAAVSMLTTAFTGGTPDLSAFGSDLVGDDPSGVYNDVAAAAKAAVKPELLGETVNMPFGPVPGAVALSVATLEALQHGWDLAKATGQSTDFDAGLCEAGLEMAKGFPPELVRNPNVWGPETEAGSGSSAADRLAAYLGRTV